MNALLETFFNTLQHGVVLVSTDAVVRYINPAAKPLLSVRCGELIRQSALSAAFHEARANRITLPAAIDLGPCASFARETPLQVQLMWSPAGDGQWLLLLTPHNDTTAAARAARAMGELINQHCREPMQRFFSSAELAVEALASHAPTDARLRGTVDRAITHGKAAVDKLSQLVAIAQAAEGVPVSLDERVEINALIEEATRRGQHLAQLRRMRIFVEGVSEDSPAIYGARAWLERAVHELVACGVYCGAMGADVLVSVSAAEGRLQISVRVAGNSAELPPRDRTFTPFFNAAEPDGLYARSLGIGLSFAGWVIERHGGHITVTDDDNGIAEFSATLPCGVPTTPGQFDSLAQVERYAEDLARLMRSPQRRREVLSDER